MAILSLGYFPEIHVVDSFRNNIHKSSESLVQEEQIDYLI